MLTRANLGYIRDTRLSTVERAAEWRAASELDTSREDAAHVVAFLRGTAGRDPVTDTVAREINKYLDRVATVIEVKDGSLREENRTIVTLRAENQELRKQLLEQPHPTMEAFEKQNDTIQELRTEIVGLHALTSAQRKTIADTSESLSALQSMPDALKDAQARIATLQSSRSLIEADRDAHEACTLRLRGELATADKERMELRQSVRQQSSKIAELKTELNVANDMTQTLQNANTDLRCAIRELQEQKTMSEPDELKPITRIPGMQYAVREVEEEKEFDDEVSLDDIKRVRKHMDLTMEIRQLTSERDAMTAACAAIKTERDALLAKNRERADRSGEEYAKSVDYTGLREAVERLGTHTHGGPSPDFLEDTQLPSASSDLDPEVRVISEVLPCIADLDIQARRRVLRYLTDRLVNDWVVGDAL